MTENIFYRRFKSKTNAELEHIINNEDTYVEQARITASQILQERNIQDESIEPTEYSSKVVTEKDIAESESENSANNRFNSAEIQELENSIKKVHRVAFTPKFKDSFQTKLSKPAFIAIALKAIENIGWDVVYYDNDIIEAKCKSDWDIYTESIVIRYDLHEVIVESISLTNQSWDRGNNSLRVKLFQLVMNRLERELSEQEIQQAESEQKKVDEWDDYVIPETLPAPSIQKKPNIYIPLIGTMIVSVLLGFILALSISIGFYVIGLFDVGVGFILGFMLSQMLKLGNYTDFRKLQAILIASVIITFISCQLFTYQLYIGKNPLVEVDFLTFMKYRFEAGLTIKSLNTGWIGILISWGLLLFLGYYIGISKLVSGIIKHQLSRIPPEVLDFVIYLFIKDKSEEQVKMELSKREWSNSVDQNYVMEAVGAMGVVQEMRRS